MIALITEMAFYFNGFPIRNHVSDFFASNADQRLFHPFLAAVAGKLNIPGFQELKIHSLQDKLQKPLRCNAFIQKGGYRTYF